MIERYTLPEMVRVWTEETKFANWMKVEAAVISALSKDGVIKPKVADGICDCIYSYIEYPSPLMQAARAKEEVTKHDLAAFVDVLSEQVECEVGGGSGRWIHFGLTSSDVVDTAFSMQLRDAIDEIFTEIMDLEDELLRLARTHKNTPIIGRTHGMHAEPTTFGLIMLNYYTEFLRHMKRLHSANDVIGVGKLSGAVGTLSHIEPHVEQAALKELGLVAAGVSSQILQRDRHAEVFTTLALIGSSVEKLATQIRLMQRTEVGEVQESFSQGQKGSSAMPHKKNPILSENLCGLARLLRGYALSAMEDVALWHERDISHSSVERVIAPDAFCLLHFMLRRLTEIMRNLKVNEDVMLDNVKKSSSWVSQSIMLEMIKAGFSRGNAYSLVQECAKTAVITNKPFAEVLYAELLDARMSSDNVVKILENTSLERHLRNVDKIFERVENYDR